MKNTPDSQTIKKNKNHSYGGSKKPNKKNKSKSPPVFEPFDFISYMNLEVYYYRGIDLDYKQLLTYKEYNNLSAKKQKKYFPMFESDGQTKSGLFISSNYLQQVASKTMKSSKQKKL